jgi:hypothetical protein
MKEIKYELSSVEKVKLKEPGMENTILAYEWDLANKEHQDSIHYIFDHIRLESAKW